MFSFSLGKIPVTVHIWFLVIGVFLMGNVTNLPLLAMWLGIFFVSVLAHELGHALTGVAFGLEPRIDLHGMGGTTSWRHKNVSTAKKILISIAGPAVGITFGSVLYLLQPSIDASNASRFAKTAVFLLIEVNLYWGLLNLLPMLPLDGGNVMAHALGAAMGQKGITVAHYISIVVAIAAGLVALKVYGFGDGLAGLWPFLIVGMFVMQNVRAIRPAQNRPPPAAPQQW